MKPVKLIMSAFGSYGGTEIIEFDKIKNGLFLIAGDTGSGKTTIFDSIMFALYDSMSGKERKSVMMRSEYASDEMETYVEFTFSYGSSIYTIKRFPAYERKSKRRNKDGKYTTIRQQAKAELTMPDGTQFNGKITQVNKKIEEITGLTAEQFNKIALIAQGEFQELVMDKTGRRKEIFRQIFSTQVYGDIEDIIFRKYKAEAAQLKYNSTKLEELVSGIEFQAESPYKEEFRIAFERKDTEQDGVTDILGREIVRLKEIYNDKTLLYNEKEKEYSQLSEHITRGREKNKLIDRLLQFELQREKLDAAKEETDNKIILLELAKKAEKVLFTEENYNNRKAEYNKADEKAKDTALKEETLLLKFKEISERHKQAEEEYNQLMPVYITKRDNLKQDVEKYRILSEKEKMLSRLETSVKNALSGKEKGDKELLKIKEEINNSGNILKSYETLELETEQIETEKKNYNEEQGLLVKLMQKREICVQEQKDLLVLSKKLLARVKKWEESRRKHEEYNRTYIACQSAFLAESLKPSCPCPVCGSAEHPYPAQMPDNAITEEMVKKAAEAERKCEIEKDKMQKEMEAAQSVFSAEAALLNEYIERLFSKEKLQDNNYFKEDYSSGKLQQIIEEKRLWLLAENKRITSNLKELKKKAADKKSRQEGLEKLADMQEEALVWIGNKEREIHKLEMDLEVLKNEIKTFKSSLAYDTKEEAERKLNECEENLNLLEKRYRSVDKELKDTQKELVSVQGAKEELIRQLKDLSSSLEELSETFQAALKENGFKDTDEYRNAITDSAIIKRMEKEIAVYNETCVRNSTGIRTIKEQLDNMVKVNLGELEQPLEELSLLMAGIKKELDQYSFYIRSGSKALERLVILTEERKAMAEKLRVIKSLNEAANGKIHFQTYIQRQYFKQIIQAANQRLSKMAPGKFLLECRDIGTGGQGETGLELDVYNPLTGKSRDAHTLSGGETFMASLAMALGMADIVQNTVGKTRLDTMFIDEGFGSLSDDARDKAVDVLLELAGSNRLVGVISHVSELKEQIPHKLTVVKGNRGSSVRWDS
ncbi:MAG: AAA family ATPase [Lachnospiraceae bacterium]|nr:AAA family ATPase [Lachnospiraceae bacterium]